MWYVNYISVKLACVHVYIHTQPEKLLYLRFETKTKLREKLGD